MSLISEGSHDDASGPGRGSGISARDRHTSAVRNSVALAHQAAADKDFIEALSWVSVLRAIGELPSDLERLSAQWLQAPQRAGVTEAARS